MSDEQAAAAPAEDKPINEAVAPGAPGQAEPSSGEESFTDFDPSSIPEAGASPEWLKEQYDLMRRDYTQKNMDMGETRRAKEELESAFTDLSNGDFQTRRAILAELGITQKEALEIFELEMAEAEADKEPEFEDDLEFKDPRVDRIEQERQAEKAERIEAEQKAEADRYAEEQGGRMEADLKEAFGGKEPPEDVAEWIFSRAIEHRDPNGNPDVKSAVQAFNKLLDQQRQEWLDSREGPRATTPGIPGSERFDPSTKAGRDALGALGAQEAAASR